MESTLPSLTVLIWATIATGFLHALAPDHWMPFVSIGRAQKYSQTKLVGVTVLSGVAHVGSSIVLGGIGLLLGFSLTNLEAVESHRAEVAGLLLIGFGLAYGLWGLKQVRSHRHALDDPHRAVTVWTLVIIFLLGPCEPLIPLMFVAAAHGGHAVFLVSVLFAAITLVMMVVQTVLVYRGIDLFPWIRIPHQYSHIIAGLVIAGTGLLVMFLGI